MSEDWPDAWAEDPDDDWLETHGPSEFMRACGNGVFVEYRIISSDLLYYVNTETLEHVWVIPAEVLTDDDARLKAARLVTPPFSPLTPKAAKITPSRSRKISSGGGGSARVVTGGGDVANNLSSVAAEGEYAYEGLDIFFETNGPWVIPTISNALKYREREVFGGGRGTLCGTHDVDLAPMGPGVALYFRLLFFLATIFALLTLTALPLLLIAVGGVRSTAAVADPFYVALLSIGNVGQLRYADAVLAAVDAAAEQAVYASAVDCVALWKAAQTTGAPEAVAVRCPSEIASTATVTRLEPRWGRYDAAVWPIPLNFILWSSMYTISTRFNLRVPYSWITAFVAGFDVLSGIIVLVGVLVFKNISEQFVAVVENKKVSASNYSVFVSGLPPGVSVAEIRDHFSTLFALDGTGYSASGAYVVQSYEKHTAVGLSSEMDGGASSGDEETVKAAEVVTTAPAAALEAAFHPGISYRNGAYYIVPAHNDVRIPKDRRLLGSLAAAARKSVSRRAKLGFITDVDPDVDFLHRIEVFNAGTVPEPDHGSRELFPKKIFSGSWVAAVELVRPMASLITTYQAAESVHAELRSARARVKMCSPGTPHPQGPNALAREVACKNVDKLSAKLAVIRKELEQVRVRLSRRGGASGSASDCIGSAFVTFEHEESYHRCLLAYAGLSSAVSWLQPPHLRFRSPAAPGFHCHAQIASSTDCGSIPFSSVSAAHLQNIRLKAFIKLGRVIDDTTGRGGIAWSAYAEDDWTAGGRGFALDVTAAPDPSDVLHENLEISLSARTVRSCATLFVTVAISALGFIFMFTASWVTTTLAATAPQLNMCDVQLPELYFGGAANLSLAQSRMTALSTGYYGTSTISPSGVLGSSVPARHYNAGHRATADPAYSRVKPTLTRLSSPSLRAEEDKNCGSAPFTSLAYRYDFSRLPNATSGDGNDYWAPPIVYGTASSTVFFGDAVPYGLPVTACLPTLVASAAASSGSPAPATLLAKLPSFCPDPRVLTATADVGVGGLCPCIDSNVVPRLTPGDTCPSLACFGEPYRLAASTPCIAFPATTLIGCYCMATLRSYQATQGDVEGALAFAAAEKDACNSFIVTLSVQTIVVVAVGFATTLVNVLLTLAVPWLAKFEGHKSLSGLERAAAWKLAVAIVINTAFVALLVNMRPPKGAEVSVPPMLTLIGLLNGVYDDFVPAWYATVGTTIMTTMIANALMTPAFMLLEYVSDACARSAVRGRVGGVLTQMEMDELFVGASFNVTTRYPVILTMAFVSLFYSTGLPLLLPLASLGFFMQYIVDKMMLLKFYRRPPAYDATMARLAITALPIAVAIKFAFGFWMTTSPHLLPAPTLTPAMLRSLGSVAPFLQSTGDALAFALVAIVVTLTPYDTLGILPRALTAHGLVYVLFSLSIIFTYFANSVLRTIGQIGYKIAFSVSCGFVCCRQCSVGLRRTPVDIALSLLSWRAYAPLSARLAAARGMLSSSSECDGWMLGAHVENLALPALRKFFTRLGVTTRGILSEAMFFRSLKRESSAAAMAGLGKSRLDGQSTCLGKGLAPFSREFSRIHDASNKKLLSTLEVAVGWRLQELDSATLEDTAAESAALGFAAMRATGGVGLRAAIKKQPRAYRGAAALGINPRRIEALARLAAREAEQDLSEATALDPDKQAALAEEEAEAAAATGRLLAQVAIEEAEDAENEERGEKTPEIYGMRKFLYKRSASVAPQVVVVTDEENSAAAVVDADGSADANADADGDNAGSDDAYSDTSAAASTNLDTRKILSIKQNSIFSENAPAVATAVFVTPCEPDPTAPAPATARRMQPTLPTAPIARISPRLAELLILRQLWPHPVDKRDAAAAERAGRTRKTWEVIADSGLPTYEIQRNPLYSAAFRAAAEAQDEAKPI